MSAISSILKHFESRQFKDIFTIFCIFIDNIFPRFLHSSFLRAAQHSARHVMAAKLSSLCIMFAVCIVSIITTSTVLYVSTLYLQYIYNISTGYNVTIDENTPPGLTIFRGITALDTDKPNTPNSDVTYSIVQGNEDRKFSIEGNQKAVVVLRKHLDFERGDSLFNLTILAKVEHQNTLLAVIYR